MFLVFVSEILRTATCIFYASETFALKLRNVYFRSVSILPFTPRIVFSGNFMNPFFSCNHIAFHELAMLSARYIQLSSVLNTDLIFYSGRFLGQRDSRVNTHSRKR